MTFLNRTEVQNKEWLLTWSIYICLQSEASPLRNFCGKLKPVSGLQNVSIVESMGWQQLVDLCITKFQLLTTDVLLLNTKRCYIKKMSRHFGWYLLINIYLNLLFIIRIFLKKFGVNFNQISKVNFGNVDIFIVTTFKQQDWQIILFLEIFQSL